MGDGGGFELNIRALKVQCALSVLLGLASTMAGAQEARIAPPGEVDYSNVDRFLDSEYPRGFIPPPFQHHRIGVKPPVLAAAQAPVRFDWREQGVVTGVRYQGSCGACYAFAGLADFESKLLIAGEGAFDFSENNLKECEWFGRHGLYPSRCQGGTYWRVVNHMAEFGTVLESCDGYDPYNSSCKQTCAYIKTVLNWRVFSLAEIPPVETTKSYIMAEGPVFAAIDAGVESGWERELNDYDGTYTLYYPEHHLVNHAVLIVGWDDTLSHAGGQGAWICKNSWGNSWGGTAGYGTEKGYFTIAYGSANLGQYAAFMEEWQDYDPCGELLFYDEAGYYSEAGYDGLTAWGMCKFVIEEDSELDRVEFWTTDATTDVDIYVYDDFNGTALSNLLASELNNAYGEMGYHSVPLSAAIDAGAEEDVYVAVKFTNASHKWPLTTDPEGVGPAAEGKCYVSSNGDGWSLAKFRNNSGYLVFHDLGIRLRIRYKRDCTKPDTVSHFRAIPGDSLTYLTWKNPADDDFAYTLIRFSTSDYPMIPEQGTPVENGYTGHFFGDPSEEDSFIHRELDNDVTYYYSAFAADTGDNYSGPVMMAAMPGELDPPGPVSLFSAEGGDRSVRLRWTAPGDMDVYGVHVRYSLEASPLTLDDGLPVENGNGGDFDAWPARADSFAHSGLMNDAIYHYSMWAFDGMRNYSSLMSAGAEAVDNVPPVFAISVLQNPYISNHLDIYFMPSEVVLDTSFVVTLGGYEITPTSVPGDYPVFRYDHEIYHGGVLDLYACGRDTMGNYGCSAALFAAGRVDREAGGIASSADGLIGLAIPGGGLREDGYIVIGEASGTPDEVLSPYSISPASAQLSKRARLSLSYRKAELEPEHLCIARVENGEILPLESYMDRDEETLVAYVDRLGTFGLVWRPGRETPPLGGGDLSIFRNAPNPFSGSTEIRFSVPGTQLVLVRVFAADGRLVKELLDSMLAPGRHSVRWDGTDRAGRKVAGGVYFFRVSTPRAAATGKMVLLH
jgi:C1A family cysteine protease